MKASSFRLEIEEGGEYRITVKGKKAVKPELYKRVKILENGGL